MTCVGAGDGASAPTTPKKPRATPKSTPKATPKGRGQKGKTVNEAPSAPTNDLGDSIDDQDLDLEGDFKGFKQEYLDDTI